jgi:arabinogalactan endo-1,4-beta-galactosidase
MKQLNLFFACVLLVLTLAPSQSFAQSDFVKGADVGFLLGQEQRGVKFHDRNGRERECLELLKNDYQMSAIRMRVWVNPREGVNDKNELLSVAKRAKTLGMELMVDFHYSDSWADPAKQPVPEAWRGHSYEEMKQDVRRHTIEVLSLLKENGIEPRWVQVGNETANGLLWPMGDIKKNPRQYAGFIRTGYDAVKKVFPKAIVIVHLDRGHNQSLYDWNLDIVKKYGGRFDMVGMSLYPYWAMEGNPELRADDIITDCMANIRHVSKKYKCDVMIVETGFEVDEQHPEKMEEGRRQLARVVREAQTETNGRCRGVFYWEPQCLPGGYKLGAFNSHAAPTAIMEGFVEAPKADNELWIKNGDRHIFGVLHRPVDAKQPMPLVIISHGFNGTHFFGRFYFDALARLGFQTYSFDFPCGSVFSRSDDNTMNMSVVDEKNDLKAIIDYFRHQPYVDASRIVLIGESQGGLVTALTAAEMPKALSEIVLVYPALCIPDNWNAHYPKEEMIPDTTRMWNVPLGRRYFQEVRPMQVFKDIVKFKRPVLIVQGDKDPVVSMKDSERAAQLYSKARLHVIPGAGHGFKPDEFRQAMEQISVFLEQNNHK